MASSLGSRMSRDDYKKAKELEELRKTGAAPPEVDEDGKMINPHIPQYISERPWYLLDSRPGLKHQRMSHFADKDAPADLTTWYQRGVVKDEPDKPKVFRKGACENCGAMTHKVKDCVERPRKIGAKHSNKDIKGDELIQTINLDFDGKRDRWNGYNPAEYKRVIDAHERAEAERTKQKAKELDLAYQRKKEAKAERMLKRKQEKKEAKQKLREQAKAARKASGESGSDEDASDSSDTDASDTDTDAGGSDSEDEFKDSGRVVQTRKAREKFTTNQTTARDLRIREDTAKYLRNLNVHSAHYDPKTRSMRENPTPNVDPSQLLYAGDNFIRKSGDVLEVQRLQSFVWEANDRGNEEIHAIANPSQAELLHQQYKAKKQELLSTKKNAVLEKYGGTEHLDAPDRSLLMAESEAYVEFDETGEVIKGLEKAIPKTKYIEDVYEANHKSVWGSYWKDGKWGYACCHQVLRAAYCTGDTAKQIAPLGAPRAPPALTASSSSSAPSAQSAPPAQEQSQSSKRKPDSDEDGSDSDDKSSRSSERKKRRGKQGSKAGKSKPSKGGSSGSAGDSGSDS